MRRNRERRRHVRYDLQVGARLTTLDPEVEQWTSTQVFDSIDARCLNLSCSGALVVGPSTLGPGRRVLVEVPLEDGTEVEAVGDIVWSELTGYGGGGEALTTVGISFSDRIPRTAMNRARATARARVA